MTRAFGPKPPGEPRRTKAELDPGILDIVIAVVGIGAGKQCGATRAGIAWETMRQYMIAGDAARTKAATGGHLTPREALFADFSERLAIAETNTRHGMLKLIGKAAEGDWRAGAWLLEKLYPKDFGRTLLDVEMTADVSARVGVDMSRLTTDDLKALKAIQTRLLASGDK